MKTFFRFPLPEHHLSKLPIFLLHILPVLLLAGACSTLKSDSPADTVLPDYPNSGLLISAGELSEKLQENDLKIVDMRSSGFEDGHIPGAINIPGPGALVDMNHNVDHFLVNSETFAQIMGEAGISQSDDLIIYDDGPGLGSARLFYALELYGHEGNINVLNGGFASWNHYDLPVDQGSGTAFASVSYETDRKEELVCDVAYISERMGSDDFVLFDARSSEEHTGENVRAERGGHIPGSVHIEWSDAISDDGIPYFKSAQEIHDMLAAKGITPDKEVVPYCQSNVRGSHVYFTLRLMGYDSVRPYEGSWSEYGNLDGAPIN